MNTYTKFCYTVDRMANDCYDLYTSDDDGYTWDYYGSYETAEAAHAEGLFVVTNAEKDYTL